jgi:uncharacterized membrane protein YdjX (TVP38/TMEM64 family)
MTKQRIILLCLFGLIISAFFYFDLGDYATLEFVKSRQIIIDEFYSQYPVRTGALFFALYVFLITLSLPAAAMLTLAAGAIFGIIWGTILVSFASSIGSTLAFLFSRYLFKDAFQEKFADKLININAGIEKEGAFYLFTIRMVPLFPLFVVNAVMGLTTIKANTFYLASQSGMLLGTIVYVNAGLQLSQIESASDIVSTEILVSLALLGLLPLISKKLISFIRSRLSENIVKLDNGKDISAE